MLQMISIFLFTIFSFNAFSDVDPATFAEKLNLYKEMESRFFRVCYGNDGENQGFLEDHIFSNAAMSPDDGTMNCNVQLRALQEFQSVLEVEVEAIRAQGTGIDLDALGCEGFNGDAIPSGVTNTAETIEREVQFNTSCEFRPEDDARNFRCGLYVSCKLATSLTVPGIAISGALPNICGEREGPERSCLDTMIEGVGDGTNNFFVMMSAAVGRFELFVHTNNSNIEDWWRQNFSSYGDRVANRVDYLTETEQAVVEWIRQYRNAPPSQRRDMLYNIGANMWNTLSDAAREGYGCEEFRDGICVRPMVDWCQASCGSKINSVCGVIGNIGAEAVLGMMFGAGFSYGALQGVRIGSEAASLVGTAARNISRATGEAANGLTGLAVNRFRQAFPSAGDRRYARRLGEINRLSRTNSRLASALAYIQAKYIFDGAPARMIMTAGRRMRDRQATRPVRARAGSMRRFSNVSARIVNGRLVLDPLPIYQDVLEYRDLALRVSQLAGDTPNSHSEAMRGMHSGMVSSKQYVINNELADDFSGVAENPDVGIITVQYTATNPSTNTTGRYVSRYALGLTGRNVDASSNLMDGVNVPVTARASASATSSGTPLLTVSVQARIVQSVETPPEPIVITGSRTAGSSSRRLSPEEIAAELDEMNPGEGDFNLQISSIQIDDIQTIAETRTALNQVHSAWMDTHPELRSSRPEMFSRLDDVPVTIRSQWLDDLETVIDRRNPDSTLAGARPFREESLNSNRINIEEGSYVATYATRTATNVEQNIAYRDMAIVATPRGRFFVDLQNRRLKELNDTLENKPLIDALNNRHNELVQNAVREFTELHRANNIQITSAPYSDYKGIRFAIDGPPGQETRLMADFRTKLEEVETRFMQELNNDGLVSLTPSARAERWFGVGVARTSGEANVLARSAPGTTWENITNTWRNLNARRLRLEETFGNTPLMRVASEATNSARVPTAEVFELLRKKSDAGEIARILNGRYTMNPRLSIESVREFQLYFRDVDSLSPGLIIPERAVHNFSDATHGGITLDFAGVGSLNAQATAEGLARGLTLEQVIARTVVSNEGITARLDAHKIAAESAIEEVLSSHGIGVRITTSGDDMVAIPNAPITHEIRAEIIAAQARATEALDGPSPASIRMSFFREGVDDVGARPVIAAEGELVEKALRARLEGVLRPDELDRLTIGMDMQGTTRGSSNIRLLTNRSLPPARMRILRENFEALMRERQ